MTLVCDGRILAFNVERAVGLEFAAMHFVDVLVALAMDEFDEFLAREGFVFESLGIDVAVTDKDDGAAFERSREARRTEKHANDEPIDGKQGKGANDAAGYGVVVAD